MNRQECEIIEDEECVTETEVECDTREEEMCVTENREECSETVSRQCETQEREVCDTVREVSQKTQTANLFLNKSCYFCGLVNSMLT